MINYDIVTKKKLSVVSAKVPLEYKKLLCKLGNGNISLALNVLLKSNEKLLRKHLEKTPKKDKKVS